MRNVVAQMDGPGGGCTGFARSGQRRFEYLRRSPFFERRRVETEYEQSLPVLPDRGAFSLGIPLAANRTGLGQLIFLLWDDCG